MSLEAEILRAVLASVPELVAALRAEAERPRMLAIKDAPVSYRLILSAERAGDLPVYRVGHASFVDEAELFAYIRRTGRKPDAVEPEPVDEIGALIQRGDMSRGRKASK